MIVPQWSESTIDDSGPPTPQYVQPELDFDTLLSSSIKVTPSINLDEYLKNIFLPPLKKHSKSVSAFLENIEKIQKDIVKNDNPPYVITLLDEALDMHLNEKKMIDYYCSVYGIDSTNVNSISIKKENGSNVHEVTIRKSLP